MTEHLLSLGRRRIDFVTVTGRYSSAARERIEGYKLALQAHGINPASRAVHRSDRFSPETDQKILRGDADALIAVNDGMAARLMRAALSIGTRVPEQISIVGFDDLAQSQSLLLTTIRQPPGDFGQQAVLTIFDRIKHPRRSPIDIHVQFELIVRRSCGATS